MGKWWIRSRDGHAVVFISFVHCWWTQPIFSIIKKWFRSFLKLSFIFHLFCLVSLWTIDSKIVSSMKLFFSVKKDRFFKNFCSFKKKRCPSFAPETWTKNFICFFLHENLPVGNNVLKIHNLVLKNLKL